jgi:hypothetical protein
VQHASQPLDYLTKGTAAERATRGGDDAGGVSFNTAVAYLFLDGAIHALQHPYDPPTLDDLANEAKCPRLRRGCTHFFLLRANGEKVLEEPLCDKEQAEMIFLCDLWALRLNVLE